MRFSSGGWSESLLTGAGGMRLRVLGSGVPSLAELLRRDDCSLPEAVLAVSLDSRPDSMVGMFMLGWRLVLPGMLWLGWLEELLEDELLLAVCGWLRLEELLLAVELDCDWDGELEDDCDGCAGGCDWVC